MSLPPSLLFYIALKKCLPTLNPAPVMPPAYFTFYILHFMSRRVWKMYRGSLQWSAPCQCCPFVPPLPPPFVIHHHHFMTYVSVHIYTRVHCTYIYTVYIIHVYTYMYTFMCTSIVYTSALAQITIICWRTFTYRPVETKSELFWHCPISIIYTLSTFSSFGFFMTCTLYISEKGQM